MTLSAATSRAESAWSAVLAEVANVRATLTGPGGMDLAAERPSSPDDDAAQLSAAVYATPPQLREAGRTGIPLMWPWPRSRYQADLPRRAELLLAAALLVAAVERLDRSPAGRAGPLRLLAEADDQRPS